MDAGERRKTLASLALLAPVILLYACEYVSEPGRAFTGFIQYDQPYYMALAREVGRGGIHLLYGNPFSADPATPAIYFQPQIWLLGAIEKLTGCDPGVLYVVFGFCAALVCVRVVVALYEQVAGLRTPAQWIGLVLFIWGGGVLALAGLLYHRLVGSPWPATMTDLFCFDPAQGWWFLNLGRNLILPMEAYYHALALGAVLCALRGNLRGMLWLAFILALSHPFTGIQFLLVLLVWCLVERTQRGGAPVPTGVIAMLAVLVVFHLTYNVLLLNQFPEHRSIFEQWSAPWTEPLVVALLADVLVGGMAAIALFHGWSPLRTSPTNRLLVVWFLVSFLLGHHELFLSPRQPLHFSRGYTWIPLFLLGVPALNRVLEQVLVWPRLRRLAALATILVLGLSDNVAWLGLHTAMALGPRAGISWLQPDGFRRSADERQVYAWLNAQPQPHDALLAGPPASSELVYLAMTDTDYRSWYSHFAATPYAVTRSHELATFEQSGAIPLGWRGRIILWIEPSGQSLPSSGLESCVAVGAYHIATYKPLKKRIND